MHSIDHRGWLRVLVFSAAIVLFVLYVRRDLSERMAFARYGRSATATVVEEAEEVPRPGGHNFAHRIEYEGRTATYESASRLPLGSQLAIEYVARPQRDLVRVLPADWPWASIFLLVVTPALALAVVQELRGKSWWAPQWIVVWRNPGRSSAG